MMMHVEKEMMILILTFVEERRLAIR